jgi:hypothetical protein
VALLGASVKIEVRGPFSNTWDVVVDGRALPGYIERIGAGYHVHPGGMRGAPWPAFVSLDEAVQALVDFHTGERR